MSEFHRMITYLYLYERGAKRHNVGFAKIEKRGGQCLVEIHMKNTGHTSSLAPVYFYATSRGKHPGILLGTMGLPRGSGDFKTILKGETLADSNYSLDDIRGIFIPLSEEIMFVSQWDDSEFIRKNFEEPKQMQETPELQAEEKEDAKQDSLKRAQVRTGDNGTGTQFEGNKAEALPGSNKAGTLPGNDEALKRGSEIGTPNSQNTPTHRHAANSPVVWDTAASPTGQDASASPTGQDTSASPAAQNTAASSPKQSKETETSSQKTPDSSPSPDLSAAEAVPNFRENFQGRNGIPLPSIPKPEPLPENWNLKWEFIMENYPVMTPFAGDEKTLCVRWELKDLRLLPRQYWYLGNNSFLLHGFFNYRYLILGITEKAEKKRWFIGIPGVYQNPERVMATLFGFPEFRNEKSAPVNTGEFGYWYRYLNE